MCWFWICAASQAASNVLTPVAPALSGAPVAQVERVTRVSPEIQVGQIVYDSRCERLTVSSVFEDGTIVGRDSRGVMRNYPKSILGVSFGSVNGVSVGDRVYTPGGSSSSVRCLFEDGMAYVEESYSGHGAKLPVNHLGVCSGSLEGLAVGEKVYTPSGVSSVVKCFYQNQTALVEQSYSGRLEIVPAISLGLSSGKLLEMNIGQYIYTPGGVASKIRSFYRNGKALVEHNYDGNLEILDASALGLDQGSIGLVAVGDYVYTSQGEKLKVKALYRNATALLEDTYSGNRKIKAVQSLGIMKCGVFDVKIGEEAISLAGRYGRVAAIYPNESVLLQYTDHQNHSFGGIVSIEHLKFKTLKIKKSIPTCEVVSPTLPSSNTAPVPSAPPAELFEYEMPESSAPLANVVVVNSFDSSGGNHTLVEASNGDAGVSINTDLDQVQKIENTDQENSTSAAEPITATREDEVCKICLEQPLSVILIPCGHYVLCDECSKSIQMCPICRDPATSKHKVYR
jgi:Zinc finger, C3HC4 type (RING finger)